MTHDDINHRARIGDSATAFDASAPAGLFAPCWKIWALVVETSTALKHFRSSCSLLRQVFNILHALLISNS